MKAKIKKTGEIFNIADCARATYDDEGCVRIVLDACDSYGNPFELGFEEVEIIQDEKTAQKDIDWEQRRYEIAELAMNGILSNESIEITLNDESHEYYSVAKDIGKAAVTCADALIAELKKGGRK